MPSQEIRLSPQQRRTALHVLDRNRLSQLTEQLGVGRLSPWTIIRRGKPTGATEEPELRNILLLKLLFGEIRVEDAETTVGATL